MDCSFYYAYRPHRRCSFRMRRTSGLQPEPSHRTLLWNQLFYFSGRPHYPADRQNFLSYFLLSLVDGFIIPPIRKKICLTPILFALLSEIPFDLALQGTFLEFSYQNVMFTLLFGFLTLWAMEKVKAIHPGLSLIPAGLGLLVGYFFHADYNWKGIVLILILHVFYYYPVEKTMHAVLPFCGNPWPAWPLSH